MQCEICGCKIHNPFKQWLKDVLDELEDEVILCDCCKTQVEKERRANEY